MKNVLDVMTLQRNVESSRQMNSKPIDYRKNNKPGVVSLFLFECATKLQLKPLTSATAAIVFHRFFLTTQTVEYDEYLIASASIYLAGKIKDDPVKVRDVINVAHCTLNRGSTPLELGEEYWSMRDSIVQAELLIARTLHFDLNFELSHKYLLYFMKTLQDWVGSEVWSSVPIAHTAASYLQDFHHSTKILNYKITHVAITCLSLALQTYGVQVPMTDESDEASMWYRPLVSDLTKEKQWEIFDDIMEVYKKEAAIKAAN